MQISNLIWRAVIGLGVILAALIGLILVTSLLFTYSGTQEYGRATSPDGAKDIVIQTHNGGATAGIFAQVYIVPHGHSAPMFWNPWSNAVLVASAEPDGVAITADWIDDQRVEVQGDGAVTYTRNDSVSYHGQLIQVAYRIAHERFDGAIESHAAQ